MAKNDETIKNLKESEKVLDKNTTIKLKVEKLYDDAPLPSKPTTNTDAGFDVVAHNVKRIYAHFGSNGEKLLEEQDMEYKFISNGVFELQSGERALIGTGLKMTIGEGYEIQVRPRSGLALKKGLTVLNAPGTIDEAFRNEVGIIIINTSRKTQSIELGERIAQIVPKKVELLEIEETKLDNDTKRGMGGFGHSNKKTKDFNRDIVEPLATNPTIKTTPFNFM